MSSKQLTRVQVENRKLIREAFNRGFRRAIADHYVKQNQVNEGLLDVVKGQSGKTFKLSGNIHLKGDDLGKSARAKVSQEILDELLSKKEEIQRIREDRTNITQGWIAYNKLCLSVAKHVKNLFAATDREATTYGQLVDAIKQAVKTNENYADFLKYRDYFQTNSKIFDRIADANQDDKVCNFVYRFIGRYYGNPYENDYVKNSKEGKKIEKSLPKETDKAIMEFLKVCGGKSKGNTNSPQEQPQDQTQVQNQKFNEKAFYDDDEMTLREKWEGNSILNNLLFNDKADFKKLRKILVNRITTLEKNPPSKNINEAFWKKKSPENLAFEEKFQTFVSESDDIDSLREALQIVSALGTNYYSPKLQRQYQKAEARKKKIADKEAKKREKELKKRSKDVSDALSKEFETSDLSNEYPPKSQQAIRRTLVPKQKAEPTPTEPQAQPEKSPGSQNDAIKALKQATATADQETKTNDKVQEPAPKKKTVRKRDISQSNEPKKSKTRTPRKKKEISQKELNFGEEEERIKKVSFKPAPPLTSLRR